MSDFWNLISTQRICVTPSHDHCNLVTVSGLGNVSFQDHFSFNIGWSLLFCANVMNFLFSLENVVA